jgi:hypothetical protein
MTSIIVIDKTANIKSLSIAKFSQDELYKKAGFKTSNGFSKITQWTVNIQNVFYNIELYGKTSGRAGQENKYEFPPPIDNTLLFGSCIIICRKKSDQIVVSITTEQWNALYEKLYGGFEDLTQGLNESSSEEDTDSIENNKKTRSGYMKDGFIVDDSEELSESDSEQSIPNRKKKNQIKNPTRISSNRKKNANEKEFQLLETKSNVMINSETPINDSETESEEEDVPETNDNVDENYLGCTKELCEEEYLSYE